MADTEQLLPMAVDDTLPESYVRPESQRPRLVEVVSRHGARIPVVDLASPDRAAVVAAIGDACRSHGFFQVLNHGIHADLIAAMMAVGRDFFRLPAAEKAKLYSDDPARKIRLSTSFNVSKETVHNWRDYLRLHCHPPDEFVPDPLDEFVPDFFNSSTIRDTMRRYCKEVRELGFRLCAAISDSLGLDAAYMKQTPLGDQEQHVAVNLYPESELTSGGLPAPIDPDALTIFLMDQDVAGLQVLHGGGKWVAVSPRPGALVISIGDQLRALATRSRDLSTDATVFQREPGARPRLGENRAAALGQGVLVDPDGIASVHTLLCYSDGLVLPLESIIAAGEEETFMRSSPDAVLVQVRVGESVGAKAGDPFVLGGAGAKATGEDDGRSNGRRGSRDRENPLGILGIMAASLAVTAAVPAAAGAITPAMAFGYALLMFTGVSVAIASIRGA